MAANTRSLDLEAGSSQYAWKDEPTGLDLTGDMTLEFWIKPETLTNDQWYITMVNDADLETETDNLLFSIRANSTGVLTWMHESGAGVNNVAARGAADLSIGAWTHVACVRDSTAKNIIFYINGSSVETVAYTNNATGGANADFVIGALLAGGGNVYADGLFDEVRVWNDIRTAQEILDNYQADVTGQSGLVGYWKLNNDYTDATGSNNLTAVGSPVFSTDVPFANYTEAINRSYAFFM